MKDLVVLFVIGLLVFVGFLLGWNCHEGHIKYQLEQVGIERIVPCNNAHSNWYEIVWKNTPNENWSKVIYTNE